MMREGEVTFDLTGGDMTDVMDKEPASGWAVGGLVFAATMMITVGIFQFIQGLAALINDEFFVVLPNYAFELDVTAWGWIHLIVGVLVALAGFYLLAGSQVAGTVAIVMAALSAVANFFFVPFYPFWSLLMIAIAVYIIWAIARTVFDS
jgi:predicted membrane metal-binding protein